MAKNNNLTDFLTDVANAIRTKKGTTGTIDPQNFSSEIASISTGVDTSDATATAADILVGKTAYAKGAKVVGTIATYDGTVEEIYPVRSSITIVAEFPGSTFGDVYYKVNNGNQVQIPCTKTTSAGNKWVETVVLSNVSNLSVMITGADVSYYQIGEQVDTGEEVSMTPDEWYDVTPKLFENAVVTVYTDD